MKILFMTAHPYLPQMMGGMQQSADALVTGFKSRGHQAAVMCALMPIGLIGKIGRLKIKLSKNKFIRDTKYGYPVYRSWFPWENVARVVELEQPDVIVVLARFPVKMAAAARQTGVPVVIKFQDVEFDEHGGELTELGGIPCIANSAFTAAKYQQAYGLTPTVIHPIIHTEKYRTKTTREYVTLINPNKQKGLDVVLAVAKACPDIPFLLQESWPLTPDQLQKLNEQLAGLPNVKLQRAVSDMGCVYGRTKILMAPSVWEEAYGRVASEVQVSGIPVIAYQRGGLAEAVGTGGILMDPNSTIDEWVQMVRKLWSDDAFYQQMSDAALSHANRPALNTQYQLDQWETFLSKFLGTKNVKKNNT